MTGIVSPSAGRKLADVAENPQLLQLAHRVLCALAIVRMDLRWKLVGIHAVISHLLTDVGCVRKRGELIDELVPRYPRVRQGGAIVVSARSKVTADSC